jgi:DNA repair protein RadC
MTYQIISERKFKGDSKIVNPVEAYRLVKRYAFSKQEQFILLTLNGAHNVISVSIISIGTVNRALVHPREIFAKAVTDRASAIIICRNHPSGSLLPSGEDKQVTQEIFKAGEVLGIPLLDHIIFTKKGFTSLKKERCFPEKENR